MITHFLILPFLLWGAAVILIGGTAGIGIGYLSEKYAKTMEDITKNKLGILGMQGAGKTRFLNFLEGKPFLESSTNRKDYLDFTYQLKNGKKITIASGKDIGGGNVFRVDYESILKNSDIILFFFNINAYLKNFSDSDKILYQRSCNSRFEHIYIRVKEEKKPVVIIATHRDECLLSDEEMTRKFNELVQNKNYTEMLKKVIYVNLTNSVETKELVEKLMLK
ncbi:GTPase domain-containing protein [Myroides phaeus]|uniref:G domain-containing protein n=1 Tax=Myroides phaeus TaxID=702745 RepID=A0A1G8FLD1_9FLAO|nr:GTPase domain-containing protein [Myroides phaeus]SDH82897.1 hypothetical protein SAMN05421818_11755 [Myroides phaeus]